MTTYKLTGEGYVIKDGTTKVPTTDTPQFPNTNPDFLEYKSYLEKGGIPFPADAPSMSIPSEITRAQGKAVLIKLGLWNSVQEFTNNIEDPVDKALAEVALNDTQTWKRDSVFLELVANKLTITPEQLDNLFIEASKIEF